MHLFCCFLKMCKVGSGETSILEGDIGMSGNFAGYRRAGSTGMAAQPKGSKRHDWLMAVSTPSLTVSSISLIVCSIAFILMREETSAESATSAASIVADNRPYRHGERRSDDGCPGARCL